MVEQLFHSLKAVNFADWTCTFILRIFSPIIFGILSVLVLKMKCKSSHLWPGWLKTFTHRFAHACAKCCRLNSICPCFSLCYKHRGSVDLSFRLVNTHSVHFMLKKNHTFSSMWLSYHQTKTMYSYCLHTTYKNTKMSFCCFFFFSLPVLSPHQNL